MDACWDQAVEAENPQPKQRPIPLACQTWQVSWRLHQLNWWTWTRDKRRPLIVHK